MSKIALIRTKSFQFLIALSLLIGVSIALAIDTDNDGMSDLYESFFSLNATNSTDAAENYDQDALSNLQEAQSWTDPFLADTDGDGFADDADSNAVSRAVMTWSESEFIEGDSYSYTGPDWWLGAEKAGGEWSTNGWVAVDDLTDAALLIDLNVSLISSNLMLDVFLFDALDAVVAVDLVDGAGAVVVANVSSNLCAGTSNDVVRRVELPLSAASNATGVAVRRIKGEALVYACSLYVDADQDGLDADQELQVGTSDLNPDCDEDGLTDGAEVLVSGTDPLLWDTDTDGLSDGEELLGSRYQKMSGSFDITGARKLAELLGAHIMTITSAEEDAHIKVLYEYINTAKYGPWIGLSDEAVEGEWKWTTGEEFVYSNWAEGQPDNYKDREDAVSYQFGKWSDCPSAAYAKRSLIVEYDQPLNALNPDTDGDTLTDGDELNKYLTSPYSADTDGDGLSDGVEAELGTSSCSNDSDNDGLLDAEELAAGTDPLTADTDGDGLTDGQELSVPRYFNVSGLYKYEAAQALAELLGGHLLTVTDAEEEQKIKALFPSLFQSQYGVWLGLSDDDQEGVWAWTTGEIFDYSNWAEGQPQDSTGQNVASYSYGQWHDCYKATASRKLIIEFSQPMDPLNPDTDGDGLSDGDEFLIHQTNPLTADTDADGLTDSEEITAGTDPVNPDMDLDGLTDGEEVKGISDPFNADPDKDGLSDREEVNITLTNPNSDDTDADGIKDLTTVQAIAGADFIDFYDSHIWSTWSMTNGTAVLSSVKNGLPSVTYEVTVDEAGLYHFVVDASLIGKNGVGYNDLCVQLFVDGCFAGRMVYNSSHILPKYTLISPWLKPGIHTVKVRVYNLLVNDDGRRPMSGEFTVKQLIMSAVDGEDVDGDGVQDWMSAQLANAGDTDKDGISDLDEITIYGTESLVADTDGDGLSDGDELSAGTDPLDEDSDDDGIVDGVEINEAHTNPLVAEFDGTITVVDTVSGSETNGTLGEWIVEGAELKAESVRGHVEYAMNFPSNEMTRLVINAAHTWTKSSCTPVIPKDSSAFLIFVDDVYVGKFAMVSADGVYVDVNAFLPVMPAGEHTVKLYWENVYSRLAVKINTLELQSLGGPDANGNGTKDWIETAVNAVAGIDGISNNQQGITNDEGNGVLQSYVSPACIEGDARYVEFMQLVAENVPQASRLPRRGAGTGWYANLPLEQDGITTATASFQNGALELPIDVEWAAFNLMDHDGETIYVRKNDMVKFVALPEEANGGQFEIEYTLGMDDETVRSPNTRPLIYLFPSAGTYTVTGEYTHGNDTVTASIQVVAVDAAFPEENPACLVGREREWSFEGMPSNVVYEVDETVEVTPSSLSEPAEERDEGVASTLKIKANDANGKHVMLARLYEGGPILASTELDCFWIQNAVDGYFWTVERYEDSELWEVQSVAKNVPDSVDIQIKVIVGGVTLDDYSLERWITSAEYSDIGEYNFRLFHPNDEKASVCHTFKVYQDGAFIAEVFGANE